MDEEQLKRLKNYINEKLLYINQKKDNGESYPFLFGMAFDTLQTLERCLEDNIKNS